MDDFFNPPDPSEFLQDMPQRYSMPAWMGPPDNWLPGLVPVELTIGRSDEAVVHISGIRAYPEGFQMSILQGTLDETQMRGGMMGMHDPHMMSRMHKEGLPDELMRFGLEFADGSKVTSLDGMKHLMDPQDHTHPPAHPILSPEGGGGGGAIWEQHYWCWPIPPAGDITFVCEWPGAGIERTTTVIDGDLIIETAKRAQQLWEDAPPMPGW